LLVVPLSFTETDLFEWDWRIASHLDRSFGGLIERTNNIAAARRVQGTLAGQPFDAILLSTDINTDPSNSEARFGAKAAEAFLAASHGWHTELLAEVAAALKGGA
jgi:hypothetical protein